MRWDHIEAHLFPVRLPGDNPRESALLVATRVRVILAVNRPDFSTSTACVVVDAHMRDFAPRRVHVQVDACYADVGEDLDGLAPLFLQHPLEQPRDHLRILSNFGPIDELIESSVGRATGKSSSTQMDIGHLQFDY